jgi:hypothetical protein
MERTWRDIIKNLAHHPRTETVPLPSGCSFVPDQYKSSQCFLACLCCFHLLCLITLSGCGCRNNLIGSAADTSFFSKSLMSVVVGAVNFNFDGWKAAAAFSNAIAEVSPMVEIKNVLIFNFSEYQYDGGGIVELAERVSLTPGSPIWSNGAQLNLLRLLRQCIKIGVSISQSFYYELRTDEALLRECLAGVLEQDGCGSGLMRSTLGHYFVRRYPRALIEMHVFSRENNAIFCGICAFFSGIGGNCGNAQSVSHIAGLDYHGSGLNDGGKSDHETKEANPVIRRFLIAIIAVIFCGLVACYWVENVWLCVGAIGWFALSMFLLVLSSYRWSWWWWW